MTADASDIAEAAESARQRGDDRVAELTQIIEAYNSVTERLQQSHETLTAEVKRLQSQLASANAALQRSKRLAALGEMAAGIAHEVRNPLASIALYARMLEQDLSNQPEQRDVASKIAAAVRGLDGIVNDVLTFSREMSLSPHAAPAPAVLSRAIEAVKPLLEEAGVEVIDEADEDHTLRHDPELLHQALVNIIRNAAQAMHQAAPPRRLILRSETDEAAARLIVADTGPGISDEAVDRIFNPFFTTRDTGTGLGLAIVHRILDAHGGSIAVHNDLETGGAVFTLTLPHETPTAENDTGEAAAANTEQPGTEQTQPAQRREADASHPGNEPQGGNVR